MAYKEERIAWQSSLGSNGVVGIIDPVTVPRGGPGEPAENRPGRPQPIGSRLGNPVSKEPNPAETPLHYPEPRANKTFNRSTRLEAAVVAADYGGGKTQELLNTATNAGLNSDSSFSTPAFNGVSITKSSFPLRSVTKTVPLNLADPERSHKPQGAHKAGTKVMHQVEVPSGGDINYMMH
mmetsp:Transcript_9562/g.13362  ORF Transcript_9562/g.13362 Transcript_9562/m.13362 type:complete len:180 (+) Transcript_9562:34-573(+)